MKSVELLASMMRQIVARITSVVIACLHCNNLLHEFLLIAMPAHWIDDITQTTVSMKAPTKSALAFTRRMRSAGVAYHLIIWPSLPQREAFRIDPHDSYVLDWLAHHAKWTSSYCCHHIRNTAQCSSDSECPNFSYCSSKKVCVEFDPEYCDTHSCGLGDAGQCVVVWMHSINW